MCFPCAFPKRDFQLPRVLFHLIWRCARQRERLVRLNRQCRSLNRGGLKAAAVAIEQPLLMGAAAVYFVLLLKDTVLPFVLGGMDFL